MGVLTWLYLGIQQTASNLYLCLWHHGRHLHCCNVDYSHDTTGNSHVVGFSLHHVDQPVVGAAGLAP